MSSAQELRIRIEELSTAIELQKQVLRTTIEFQKQVLRDLESSRIDARRALNTICDPIARLPFEIASDIFTCCLPSSPRADPGNAPLLLLNICRLWSDVALATSSLWADVHFSSSLVTVDDRADIWIRRARTHPLSLSLRGAVHDCVALLQQHAHQVQNLVLYIEDMHYLPRITSPFSSLKQLTFDRDNDAFVGYAECLDIMRAAPDLLECTFNNFYLQNPEMSLTHTRLQRLRLGNHRARLRGFHNSAQILCYLTLPSLETLEIAQLDISNQNFISFLARSSPPLRSLQMAISSEDWPSDAEAEYSRLMPNLTDLELVAREADDPELELVGRASDDHPILGFFNTQATVPSQNFFPGLRNLTIWATLTDRLQYEHLISVLRSQRASRHPPLQSFRLIYPFDFTAAPDGEIVATLQQLAKDHGMRIHVGPENINYLV